MPATTRRVQERDADATEQPDPDDASARPEELVQAPAPSPASETPGAPAGRVARTPRSTSRLAERARELAGEGAGAQGAAPGLAPSSAFSQEQLAEIANLFKQALSNAAAAPSTAPAASLTPAGAPAVESGATVEHEHDANTNPADAQKPGPGDDLSSEYVPDYGINNPHARAVNAGGDTYSRPQRYNMYRDVTHDLLATKPKGTLFKEYCTLEPACRYLFNVKSYGKEIADKLEAGTISSDEIILHIDRVVNSVAGIYDLINRHVGLIHLRAKYGDNPTPRERAKLEHIEDVLTEEDFLPASLDDRIRDIAREFDDSYDSAKKTALAKKAAGFGGGKGDDGGGPKQESRRDKAKRLEAERKAADAKKKADADKAK